MTCKLANIWMNGTYPRVITWIANSSPADLISLAIKRMSISGSPFCLAAFPTVWTGDVKLTSPKAAPAVLTPTSDMDLVKFPFFWATIAEAQVMDLESPSVGPLPLFLLFWSDFDLYQLFLLTHQFLCQSVISS